MSGKWTWMKLLLRGGKLGDLKLPLIKWMGSFKFCLSKLGPQDISNLTLIYSKIKSLY